MEAIDWQPYLTLYMWSFFVSLRPLHAMLSICRDPNCCFSHGHTHILKTPSLDAGKNLDVDIVRQAFQWSLDHEVPLAGFTGDEAVTMKMEPELEVLSRMTTVLLHMPCES